MLTGSFMGVWFVVACYDIEYVQSDLMDLIKL